MRLAGLEVHTAAAAYEHACGRLSLYSVLPQKLICSGVSGPSSEGSIYQLLLNGIAAVICFLVTLPLLLCAFVLLRLSTRGPVWCSQPLVGLNGCVFQAYSLQANGGNVFARSIRQLQMDKSSRD